MMILFSFSSHAQLILSSAVLVSHLPLLAGSFKSMRKPAELWLLNARGGSSVL